MLSMATENKTTGTTPKTTTSARSTRPTTSARSTAARRATASAAAKTRSASTAAKTRSTSSRTTARSSARTAGRSSVRRTRTSTSSTRGTQFQQIAERAMLVPFGAGLVAQENFVSTVRGLATKYGTRASVEREIKRYEQRGATARNRFERQVRRTRTQFERALRERRSTLEQAGARLEREVRRSPIVNNPAARFVAGARS
jgi:hypothetical protein